MRNDGSTEDYSPFAAIDNFLWSEHIVTSLCHDRSPFFPQLLGLVPSLIVNNLLDPKRYQQFGLTFRSPDRF